MSASYCAACPYAARNASITVAECTLEPGSNRLSFRGNVIRLSPKRTQLLALLMGAHGRVVSRALIDERLWPDGDLPGPHVMDAHVSYLRRQISGTPLQIRAVYQTGYELVTRADAAAVGAPGAAA